MAHDHRKSKMVEGFLPKEIFWEAKTLSTRYEAKNSERNNKMEIIQRGQSYPTLGHLLDIR